MRNIKSKLFVHILSLTLIGGSLFSTSSAVYAESAPADIVTEAADSTDNNQDDSLSDTEGSSEESTENSSSDSSSDTTETQPEDSSSDDTTETKPEDSSSDTTETQPEDSSSDTTETQPENPSSEPAPAKPAPPVTTVKKGAGSKKKQKRSDENLTRWMDTCEKVGKNLRKKKFRYGNRGTRSTYSSALSNGKRSNCALYVSWCLQEYGALKKGRTFYVRRSGSIKKNFKRWGRKVKVIRVNSDCSSANLQKGDVVCWSGIGHCNIYAGTNSSGDRLWFDAGKSATYSGRSGSRYENVGAKTQSYLDSRHISYIVRIKGI